MGGGSDKRFVVVESPLTGAQLVRCAKSVVVRVSSGGSAMVHMVERQELEAMAREAVVLADRSYQPCDSTRQACAVGKGTFLTLDMIRLEARHTVCLSTGEFRGTVLDDKGNRVKSRGKISIDDPIRGDNDLGAQPISHIRATESPLWINVHDATLCKRLDQALDKLKDHRSSAMFQLAVLHEWTQAEIAELFGVSASRVSQINTRTSKRLRYVFADLAPEKWAA